MTHLATVATFRVGDRVRVTTNAFELVPNRLDYRKGDTFEVARAAELYCVGVINGEETVIWNHHLERTAP